jgi:hypothetical protein
MRWVDVQDGTVSRARAWYEDRAALSLDLHVRHAVSARSELGDFADCAHDHFPEQAKTA